MDQTAALAIPDTPTRRCADDPPRMSNAAYQPVPSDLDDTNDSVPQPKPPEPRHRFLRLTALVLALSLLVAIAFKAGQWSALSPSLPASESIEEQKPSEDTIDDVALEPTIPPPLNETEVEMPGNGKYSVG